MKQLKENYAEIIHKLEEAGIRPTRQRIFLASLLWEQGCRHVTAEGLHMEALAANIRVSLATVYNTLHQFTEAGLLRQIMLKAGRCYFDTNTAPHHHFLNEDTGYVMDIPAEMIEVKGVPLPPEGKIIGGVDVIVRVKESV